MNQNANVIGRGVNGKGETPEFKTLLEKSMNDLRAKTMGHTGWGFGKADQWSLDMSQGDLVFTFASGMVARAPAQIIGSLDTSDGSWLWGWANPSIPDKLKRDSARIREYGQQHKIERLIAEEWQGSEEDAWQMAALACTLCEAQGVYRGPAGTALVFISFGSVVLSKKP